MKKSIFRETHKELEEEVAEMLEIVPEEEEEIEEVEEVEEKKVEAKKRGRKRLI